MKEKKCDNCRKPYEGPPVRGRVFDIQDGSAFCSVRCYRRYEIVHYNLNQPKWIYSHRNPTRHVTPGVTPA